MQFHVVHVVRRFGRVGGMENYVWYLIDGLVRRNIKISVICEESSGHAHSAIDIFLVKKSPERPRWKSMLAFRAEVENCLAKHFINTNYILHSHERTISHDVTTIHGPMIERGGKGSLLSQLNPRIRAWKRMEFDELFGPRVKVVLAVSELVKKELESGYPALLQQHQILIAWPGVSNDHSWPRLRENRHSHKCNFLFIGREWKRKGLIKAFDVVEAFSKLDTEVQLTIVGPTANEIPRSIRRSGLVKIVGWRDSIDWSGFDILIHPAQSEPFGMVVAEARNFGLPVLMSSQVGAAALNFSHTRVLPVEDPSKIWALAAKDLMESNTRPNPEVKWTWDELVDMHLKVVYPKARGAEP